MAGTVVLNAMMGVQKLWERLVGNIVRRTFEYWCNAEKDLSERVEMAFAPESP
jgi:hypothetical protein